MGLLRDFEIFANLTLTFVWSSSQQAVSYNLQIHYRADKPHINKVMQSPPSLIFVMASFTGGPHTFQQFLNFTFLSNFLVRPFFLMCWYWYLRVMTSRALHWHNTITISTATGCLVRKKSLKHPTVMIFADKHPVDSSSHREQRYSGHWSLDYWPTMTSVRHLGIIIVLLQHSIASTKSQFTWSIDDNIILCTV